MLTGKQRAFLRSKANAFPPVTQIGKEGITAQLIAQLNDAIRVRELIKIHVLENSCLESREALDALCKALHAEGIQCIGRKIVLFRQNPEKTAYELPR